MPIDPNILYPENYAEPEIITDPPLTPAEKGRDFVEALALIRRAVPEGGDPMTVTQLVCLVIGYINKDPSRSPQAHTIVASVDADEGAAISTARAGISRGQIIKGPAACESIKEHEVVTIIRQEMIDRRGTWTFQEATAEPIGVLSK